MKINNTTTYETQQSTTTNSTQTTAVSFEISNYVNKEQKDIKLDEHKNLTEEKIEQLYP